MTWPLVFITVHPRLIETYRTFGVMRSAEQAGLAAVSSIDLRDFAADKHGSVDAAPYGGGDGMVMRPDCLASAVEVVFARWAMRGRVVYTSPSGKPWSQSEARRFADDREPTVFICGRFAGVDQRFIDAYVTDEYSIGDVVLAGGELAALAMAESALRLVPGVLGNKASAAEDSFSPGLNGLLEYPSYTRPQIWNGIEVPPILLAGNHADVARWRQEMSLDRTKRLRPDLLRDTLQK